MKKKDKGPHGPIRKKAQQLLQRILHGNPWERKTPACAGDRRRLLDGIPHTCPSGCLLPGEGCIYMQEPMAYENRCALCPRCTKGCMEDGNGAACRKAHIHGSCTGSCGCGRETEDAGPWQ